MGKKVLLVGEPMNLFIAKEEAPLTDVRLFDSAIAGAEYNVAVGLSRLGHSVGYVARLGRDMFAQRIKRAMEQNGIDTSLLSYSDERPTGFMLKGKTSHGDPEVAYFRKNSAASTLSVADVEGIDLTKYDALHMTGILPALSASALEVTHYLMEKAKKAGLTVFFDPNLRPQLWPDEATMARELNSLALLADYVLPGYKEGGILCGTREPREIADYFLSRGAKAVVIKTGRKGAFGATKDRSFQSPTFQEKKLVDTVGAGDGFATGVISAVLEGLPLEEAARRGNAIGTIQVQNPSDNEGLPTREELEQFLRETPFLQAD